MSHEQARDPIDAWLRLASPELPDEGFTEAVLRRVEVEEHARSASLDAQHALERLRALGATERRQGQWRLMGALVGAVAAALWAATAGDLPATVSPAQGAALVTGLMAAAWWLTDGATGRA
jgi:hypothetical protein